MNRVMTDAVNALLERFRSGEIGRSKEINPFWRDQLTRLDKALRKGGPNVSMDRIRGALGYNAFRLPPGAKKNADRTDWADLMRAVEARDVEGPGHVVEHVGALAFLKRSGHFESYLAWVDGHGVMSAMDLARHYWYASKLARYRDKGAPPVVCLEVGSGSGRFATRLVELGIARQFVLVDLPEMLLNAMLLVGEMFPQAEIRYGETPDFSQPGLIFWMLETSDIRRVPDRSIDIALNFYSFMEMDEAVRDFYIGQIYRAAAPGALFYNVNRRQGKMTRRDGATFDNNPLLYPYPQGDTVLEWEPDDFQQSNRSDRFIAPTKSFAISRIARVA